MKRDRERSKERLVEAAVELLRTEGFDSLGINSVAAKAGLSKVLIYRYFGGLDGLLKAVAGYHDLARIRSVGQSFFDASPDKTLAQISEEAVMKLHRELQKDELTLELLAWELSNKNLLTDAFAEAREDAGLELTKKFAQLLASRNDSKAKPSETIDVEALISIVSASVYYLTLRSRHVQYYNGIDLHSESGWKRIASLIGKVAELLVREQIIEK